MSNKITYEYLSRDLTLDLLPGWGEYKPEGGEDIPLTFFRDQDGVGVLQISIATTRTGENFNISELLKRNRQEYITEINQYESNGLTVYEYEDIKNGFYTKFFNLIKLNLIVLATYNSPYEQLNKVELDEASEIVRTLEVTSRN